MATDTLRLNPQVGRLPSNPDDSTSTDGLISGGLASGGGIDDGIIPIVIEEDITLRDHFTGKVDQMPVFGIPYSDHGARHYNPALRRWMTPDPLSEKYYGLSPYSYCNNDPVNRIDPDGNWDVTVHLYDDRAVNGYGYACVTDNNGNEVFRFNVRAEGVNGHDRFHVGGDTPFGTYDIPIDSPWLEGGNRQSYGPNSRLNMIPESGEIYY